MLAREKKISIRAPEELVKSLKMHCINRGVSITYYLLSLIKRDLELANAKQEMLPSLESELEKLIKSRTNTEKRVYE